MAWSDDREERDSSARGLSKLKVCSVCRKIILRKDDLYIIEGKVYCGEHAPEEATDG